MEKSKRKELAYNYAHSHRPMGVYRIVNTQNDKSLVGSSLNLEGVWNKHQFMLEIGNHDNKTLQADWKEYGKEAFSFEILEQIKPEEDFVAEVSELAKYRKLLPDLEDKWMQQLAPYGERGYHKQK
ncbi:GIY-YIG nuclease family protein [Paenibacillus sp. BAC0078]